MKSEGHPGKEISYGAKGSGPLRHRFPLIAYTVGESWWRRGDFVRRNCSDVFVVEMVISGNVHYVSDSKNFAIGPNEAFILHKKSMHEYRVVGAEVAHKLYASIDGPILEQVLLYCGLKNAFHIRIEQPLRVEQYFRGLLELGAREQLLKSVESSQLAYLIISELSRSMKNQRFPSPVRKALTYMGRNLNKPLKLQGLCDIANVSEASLHRLFNEYCNESPIEYFNRQKLRAAQELLKRTSLSVKEIATTLGFDNPSYFSRLFRKKYGLTARAFREQYVKSPEPFRGEDILTGDISRHLPKNTL